MSDVSPEGTKDRYTRERLQHIARLIDDELPMGWGFVLLAFPFQALEGRLNYVSSGRREDIRRIVKEWLDKGGPGSGHH